jgi:MFS family permease
VVLAVINLLNYLDRYVLSAVLPWIDADFSLSDNESGLLGSVFMLVHLSAAPFAGYLGDRRQRKYIVAGSVFLWSLATVGSGLAPSYDSLLVMRALVGIGEAGYATVAPGMIADLFVADRRARVLAWFYMAIPVGTALGYMVGGAVADDWGWRAAFLVAGAPGVLATLAALLIREPRRGGAEPPLALEQTEALEQIGALDANGTVRAPATAVRSWRRVAASPVWWFDTLATASITFALGGLAFWMPTFLVRQHQVSGERMGLLLGAILLGAGVIATPLGGVLGDRAVRRSQGGHLRFSGRALFTSVPLILVLPYVPGLVATLTVAFAALFALGLTIGPINAVLVSCVPPAVRSTAVALNLILVHLLGDALSPWLLGVISDASSLRLAIAVTALPVALGAAVLAFGARRVDRRGEGLQYTTSSV